MPIAAAVVTVSDRSARGERVDASGPLAVAALRAAGYTCHGATVVADGIESVEVALRQALASGSRVVVTTGGTRLARRDLTPEGTARVAERTLPGIAEELRRRGSVDTPAALLSRGLAAVSGSALIVNLPGSPRAVESAMPLIVSLAPHVLDQLDGGDH